MTASGTLWAWFLPALLTLFFYGIGQGLVKKWVADVPPARFCLYFVAAKSLVNLGYVASQGKLDLTNPDGFVFLGIGIFAFMLDGLGWILYFQSIVYGPITIVGTLSAAYPALTAVFAGVFLGEQLIPLHYGAVAVVIAGCIGLSYDPSGSAVSATSQKISRRWIPLAAAALVLWATTQTISKYTYTLPMASEGGLALCNTIGGLLTLGVYGVLRGWKLPEGEIKVKGEWLRSFLPMGLMAAGDLGVIIANKFGPISLVTPITGAYPVVTLAFAALVLREKVGRFQWFCVALILVGMQLVTYTPSS
ncbi:MAG: EamA family transporter [Candidatus Sericytochromatia bacterium]|uniref:EamA family transporter n=1 Tax=Candidatus Tanganyikabacteria bacterium TaxID=2961651 RepID=A0A937X4P0_9BACT|nr:EamA family transporter [Candidatus Tanganyikabacteria bacterium]